MIVQAFPILLIAYLIGSFPSAYILTRLALGKDIRHLGDGNMGAKNVFHSVGWLPGVVVAVLDILKGAMAIIIARGFHQPEGIVLAAGVCAILGHDFPLFVHFRGGQGMATILGTFGMLFPRETIIALCVLGLVLAISHNWDFSCTAAFILLVFLMWIAGQPPKRLIYPLVVLPTIAVRKIMQRWQASHATV